MSKQFKVLVLSGGGCKGYLQANVLKYLELKTGKKIHELFDLIVGTSTGGILTYGVTCGDYNADTIIKLYETEGKNIFQKRFLSFFNSKFKIEGLITTLEKYFGKYKLSDCKVKTITTARDKLNKKNMIFKSWSEHWKDLDVLHAVVSTSAAPDYFPTYEFKYKGLRHLAWDGGVFAANPAIVAQIEANALGYEDKDIVMLNLGTGFTQSKGYDTINPNKLTLVNEITSDMLDSQSELATYAMSLSLKNYYYWDILIPESASDMADYKSIPLWKKLVDEDLSRNHSLDNFIDTFFVNP